MGFWEGLLRVWSQGRDHRPLQLERRDYPTAAELAALGEKGEPDFWLDFLRPLLEKLVRDLEPAFPPEIQELRRTGLEIVLEPMPYRTDGLLSGWYDERNRAVVLCGMGLLSIAWQRVMGRTDDVDLSDPAVLASFTEALRWIVIATLRHECCHARGLGHPQMTPEELGGLSVCPWEPK